MHIFEVRDASGRLIRLTRERWRHVNEDHPEVAPYLREVEETLKDPMKAILCPYGRDVWNYYRYVKQRRFSAKFLLVQYLRRELISE